MTEKLHLSASPHIHTQMTVQKIMLSVIIALLPATGAGIYYFGVEALVRVIVCVLSCVASEFLFNIILKKEQSISDLSAVVTGLILALNVSANVPVWQCVIGSVFAIIIVKCLFGGLGCNIVNPAATARVFMLIAFAATAQSAIPKNLDAVSSATPLVQIANGEIPDLMDLFLGRCGGAIGETCSLALLVGGVYLIVRKIIGWQIPVAFVGTVFLFTYFVSGMSLNVATASVLSGGLLLGAFFMATDYVTNPSTPSGKLIYGFIAGVITVLIRKWGVYPEGVSFAILLVNILNPYIDIWTARRVFGGKKA